MRASILFCIFTAFVSGFPIESTHNHSIVQVAHPQIMHVAGQIEQIGQVVQVLELQNQKDESGFYGLVGLESYLRYTAYFLQVVQAYGVDKEGELPLDVSKRLEWMSTTLYNMYMNFAYPNALHISAKLGHWYNTDRLVLEQWKLEILRELQVGNLFYYYPRVNCGYVYLMSGAFWDGLSRFSYTGFVEVVRSAFPC